MEESTESVSEVQTPAVACDYVAASMTVGMTRQTRRCDPDAANCRGGDPNSAWSQKYSVCREKGNICPCYWEKQTSNGFVEKCRLYGFLVDKSDIWNRDADKELFRKLGITR